MMMKRIILLFLLCITCACIDAGAQATSAADRLYARGVTYMKTMTISMQKKAIAAFGKAKVAYDSKAKKIITQTTVLTITGGNVFKNTSREKSAALNPSSFKERGMRSSILRNSIITITRQT